MPLRVNHNITALTARRALGVHSRMLSTRIERLATGLRINRAAADAAGLAISEGMRAEIGGLIQAVRNAEQATNLTQVAEGALNEVNAMLIRGSWPSRRRPLGSTTATVPICRPNTTIFWPRSTGSRCLRPTTIRPC